MRTRLRPALLAVTTLMMITGCSEEEPVPARSPRLGAVLALHVAEHGAGVACPAALVGDGERARRRGARSPLSLSQADPDERAVGHAVDILEVAVQGAGAVGPGARAGDFQRVVSDGSCGGGEAAAQGVSRPVTGEVGVIGQALDHLGGGLRRHASGRVADRAAVPGDRWGKAVPAVDAEEQRALGVAGAREGAKVGAQTRTGQVAGSAPYRTAFVVCLRTFFRYTVTS